MSMLDTGQLPLIGEALLGFRQGLAAAAEDNYAAAVDHFDNVVKLRADFYQVWYERGLALEQLGRYQDAIASFDHALNLQPKQEATCEIWHQRANALQYGLGDYLSAIACYDQALTIKPDHDLAWQNRGNALLYGLSRAEEALVCYEKALSLNSDNTVSWRNRGNALVEMRRYPEAIVSYDRALAIDPDDQISWHARSLASEKSGLTYQQPTTNPVWSAMGYDDTNIVDRDTHSSVSSARGDAPIDEFVPPQLRHPLLVLEDDWGRREIFLDRDQYTIGRDPGSDICLHSQFASRQHAVISHFSETEALGSECAYKIVDGNLDGKPSTNGLLINGQKRQKRFLQPGDVIVFGPNVQATFQLSLSRVQDN